MSRNDGLTRALLNGYGRSGEVVGYWGVELRCGYFCLLSLNDAEVKVVESAELRGANISAAHLARSPRRAAAIDIGAIAAHGRPAKAAALAYLDSQMLR
jgi:hypothetical protein